LLLGCTLDWSSEVIPLSVPLSLKHGNVFYVLVGAAYDRYQHKSCSGLHPQILIYPLIGKMRISNSQLGMLKTVHHAAALHEDAQ